METRLNFIENYYLFFYGIMGKNLEDSINKAFYVCSFVIVFNLFGIYQIIVAFLQIKSTKSSWLSIILILYTVAIAEIMKLKLKKNDRNLVIIENYKRLRSNSKTLNQKIAFFILIFTVMFFSLIAPVIYINVYKY
jgi:hypothetical protein